MKVFILVILILQAIQKSSISTIFSFFIHFFEKNKGLNFMKWVINKAFLTPSVEQLLGHQIDSWTSKDYYSCWYGALFTSQAFKGEGATAGRGTALYVLTNA